MPDPDLVGISWQKLREGCQNVIRTAQWSSKRYIGATDLLEFSNQQIEFKASVRTTVGLVDHQVAKAMTMGIEFLLLADLRNQV